MKPSYILLIVFLMLVTCKKDDDVIMVKDIDGNLYHFETIGTQVWMLENLKTTRYKDGTVIPNVKNNTAWSNLVTPGYCWYDNDEETYKDNYGALYNWYTIETGKLCPSGWHVPTDDEWITLTDYLGGQNIAGGKLKESGTMHWENPNTDATNESCFTALPGGYRTDYGSFGSLGSDGIWWSATEYSASHTWIRYMTFSTGIALRTDFPKENGFSIRCVRDD